MAPVFYKRANAGARAYGAILIEARNVLAIMEEKKQDGAVFIMFAHDTKHNELFRFATRADALEFIRVVTEAMRACTTEVVATAREIKD